MGGIDDAQNVVELTVDSSGREHVEEQRMDRLQSVVDGRLTTDVGYKTEMQCPSRICHLDIYIVPVIALIGRCCQHSPTISILTGSPFNYRDTYRKYGRIKCRIHPTALQQFTICWPGIQ